MSVKCACHSLAMKVQRNTSTIQKRLVDEIVGRYGGMCAGTGPGELYDQKKFDTPYIRDFLLDRGALADVSETSAPWSQLERLYSGVMSRAREAFDEIGVRGYIMCHLAHSYHSGACLYFTYAFRPSDELARWNNTTWSRARFNKGSSTWAELCRTIMLSAWSMRHG